jgi:hypothetical protein
MRILRLTLTFAFSALWLCAMPQARIVFQNNPFIVIDNGAYLVIDNPAVNAITNPTVGNIVSENEFDYVKWNIRNTIGTYTVPFTTTLGTKIPFNLNISVAGNAGTVPAPTHVLFSNYGGNGAANWDSDVNAPTGVIHTNDIATNTVNNAAYTIDRFWIVDATSYASRPTATFDFGYADIEHTAVGNTITESDLGAQRYNSGGNIWGDYLPQGTANTGPNTVTGVPVSPANFFRVWTLSSIISPLPIELLSMEAKCDRGLMTINWSTASETNNDFFLLERSDDGISWEPVKTIPGAGNSSTIRNYSVNDLSPYDGTTYYQLTQFDFNGDYETFTPCVGFCSDSGIEIVTVYNNFNSSHFTLTVNSTTNEQFDLYLLDMSGKVVATQSNLTINAGTNQVEIYKGNLPMGIYMVKLVNGNHLLTRKVALN